MEFFSKSRKEVAGRGFKLELSGSCLFEKGHFARMHLLGTMKVKIAYQLGLEPHA